MGKKAAGDTRDGRGKVRFMRTVSRCKPLDAGRKAWITKQNREAIKQAPQLAALQRKLLSYGGQVACLTQEPDLTAILERGQIWSKANLCERPGRRNRCHYNSARLWAKHATFSIVSGWCLSVDGIWRQHTFCWDKRNQRIIETTVKRVAYFGFELTDYEALKSLYSEMQGQGLSFHNLDAKSLERAFSIARATVSEVA